MFSYAKLTSLTRGSSSHFTSVAVLVRILPKFRRNGVKQMKLHNSQILSLLSHIRLLPLRYSGRDITCKNKVNCFKSKIGFNAMFVLQRMTAS